MAPLRRFYTPTIHSENKDFFKILAARPNRKFQAKYINEEATPSEIRATICLIAGAFWEFGGEPPYHPEAQEAVAKSTKLHLIQKKYFKSRAAIAKLVDDTPIKDLKEILLKIVPLLQPIFTLLFDDIATTSRQSLEKDVGRERDDLSDETRAPDQVRGDVSETE